MCNSQKTNFKIQVKWLAMSEVTFGLDAIAATTNGSSKIAQSTIEVVDNGGGMGGGIRKKGVRCAVLCRSVNTIQLTRRLLSSGWPLLSSRQGR